MLRTIRALPTDKDDGQEGLREASDEGSVPSLSGNAQDSSLASRRGLSLKQSSLHTGADQASQLQDRAGAAWIVPSLQQSEHFRGYQGAGMGPNML